MANSVSLNRITKILAWSLLGLVSLIILLVSVALSSVGTRWAIDYVNDSDLGVAIVYKSGSFYSNLELQQVLVTQEGLDVRLDNVSLDVKLSCLFAAEVCIKHIRLNKVAVALGELPKSTAPEEEIGNALIKLPVLVSLDEFSVGELLVSQHDFEMLRAKKFSLSLSFLDQLSISKLDMASFVFNLPKPQESTESGEAKTISANDLPRPWLKELANFKYQPISLPQVFIPITLDLKDAKLVNICVRQQLEDDSFKSIFCNENLAIKLTLKNQKLDSTLIFSNFNQNSASPAFVPSNLKLKASVNFAKNFEHELTLQALKKDTPVSALSQTTPKKNALKIDTPIFNDSNGVLIKSKGDINKLDIALTHLPSQSKAIAIKTAIQLNKSELPLQLDFKFEPLSAAALDDIRTWLPDVSEELIAQLKGVSVLAAKVSGDMQGYRVTALVNTKPISGIENVEMNALIKPYGGGRGAWSLIDIKKLQVSGEIGSFDYLGKATIETIANKQTQLSWQGNLSLESLQLAKLNESLNSMISGAIPHQFALTETTQSGSVKNARLTGNWQNLPLLLKADAELEKTGNVKVQSIQLNQGDNKVDIQGSLYSQQALASLTDLGASFTGGSQKSASSLDFVIDLTSLADLYPDLKGQLNAKGNISGPIEIPKIVMQANTQELSVGDISLEEADINLSVNMANKLKSTASIQATNLFAGGQNIPKLNLQLDGDENEQSLRLSIPEGAYITEQFFKGQLSADNTSWTGKWLEGKVVSNLAELVLQSEPELKVNLQPFSLFLAQHCWEGRSDKLCIGDVNATQVSAKTKIALDYNVMNAGMVELLPSVDVSASDLDLNIDVDVDWQKVAGLTFSADIVSQNATLVSNENKVTIENITAKVEGTPTNISSRFLFKSTQAGHIDLNSQLDLSNKPFQHKGDVIITDFAVSYFAPFITAVKRLNGDINANITFDGPMEKPALQGKLSLANGAFVLKEYPLRLANYNQEVTFEGSKADFVGTYTLGEGKGSINGDIDFTNELIINTEVKGDKLDIAYETYQFKVSPDIQLNLQPELLRVTGKIDIPYARVKIKTLPPSAKSPSQDIIIVDEKQVAKQSQLPLDVRINILIDKAKKGEVKLDALDLKAELSGDLNVQVDAQNTRVNGIVQVLKGDYAAYGQVLQIRKGDITFSGQPDVPAFDIEAIRNPLNTKNKVIAGIRVTGNALKPSVELFSEPSMEEARQLSYLISGADNFGAGGDSSDANTLVNALVSFGVGKSENGIGSLGQKLGVKDLNLQTAGQGGDTKVQLSGQLAEGVKVTYGVGVFDSLSEVSVHYQLLPQLYLEAVSGVNNTLDLYYQISSKD